MKDKILFVCPTDRWEARERSLLFDMRIAHEKGRTILFYGLENSPLDKRIKFENVEKIYHSGLSQTHFILWPKLSQLYSILEDKSLALVHCYELNILWPICFFLRGNKEVSLILSQFFEMKKNYRALWHKLLIRRCDLVFVPYEHLVRNIWSRLGVHLRNIEIRPPCLEDISDSSEGGVIFEKFEHFHSIGFHVSESDRELKYFLPFVKALSVANEHFNWEKPIKLVFVTEGIWSETEIYQDLKQLVLSEGVGEHIVFYAGGAPSSYVQHFDLWMSLYKEEGMDDLALMAASVGTPLLLPRHPSSVEFFDDFGKVGETFKNDDVREIVQKWELILSDTEVYQDQLQAVSSRISEENSYSNQENQYIGAFEKLVARRKRYREGRTPQGPSL